MKKNKYEYILDVWDVKKIENLETWCKENLSPDEFDSIIMGLFPLHFRFKFYCPKIKLLAILSV